MPQKLSPKEAGLCQQFAEFTGASVDVAQKCLRRQGWNIQQAMELFWENPEDFAPPPPPCDVGQLEQMFLKYKDPQEDAIGIEGLLQFCEDLGIAPGDVRMLILCFHLAVKSSVRWTKQEFVQGLLRLGCDSISKIRDRFHALQADLIDPVRFKTFYSFAFEISRAEGQKVLDLETALTLWRLILSEKFKHIESWCDFLETEYKRSITKDTWMLTLDFALTADDRLSNIDLENSAWPVVIDEFVEFARARLA